MNQLAIEPDEADGERPRGMIAVGLVLASLTAFGVYWPERIVGVAPSAGTPRTPDSARGSSGGR
jgi:hypothetical protein